MKNLIIGRVEEQQILEKALASSRAEMVAVIGRRRIGKTFLVKSVYKNRIDFEITGIENATRQEQLQNFVLQLAKFSNGQFPKKTPSNWLEAFDALSMFLESIQKSEKIIVFLDELPWLVTHKSGFLKGLSRFWNSWAVNQHIVVVVCGSAASWMIKKVVHHKGGLHNRITKRIYLKPFNLAETEHFFQTKNFNFDRYQILHLYMAMGGIPFYLEDVEAGKSAAQNINQICFSQNGLLQDEFPKLFSSLFKNPEKHVAIIRVLAKKRKGLTRSEIVTATKLSAGGGMTTVLNELLQSGYISEYYPFGKQKKGSLYRLTDEYSLFYLQFIEHNRTQGANIWQQLSQTSPYTSWTGYTFESICLKHLKQIKKSLGISGVYAIASSFIKQGGETAEGTQIDLVIDRNDHVINICEMKFYSGEWTLTKSAAMQLRNKIAIFKAATKTRKQVFLTLITTFGINQNKHSLGLVDTTVTMDDLFEK